MALRNNPCQGLFSKNWQPWYKKIGHWSPETESSPVRSFSLVLLENKKQRSRPTATYSKSDQSTPAGQRSAPVTSWLNPLSVLILRAIGGRRGSPGGESQSIMADLRLFVSSDLAPEAPFCSCGKKCTRQFKAEMAISPIAWIYHHCTRMDLVGVAWHQAFL